MYSEIYQRTGPIARLASMIAGHGYVVAVPEIFHELHPAGTVLAYDEAGTARGNSDKVTKPVAGHDADLGAVVDCLAEDASCDGAIGAFGVCIGGHLALRAALHPRVSAAACFYATDVHKASLGAGGDDTLARIKEVHGELLLVWGRQDPHVGDEGRTKIREAMGAAGVSFEWHEVNAQHAFLRDEGARYDPALARWGIECTLGLMRRALG